MGQLPLAEVISDLRMELERAIRDGSEKTLRFEVGVIEVELSVAIESAGRAGVKFWVIDLGGSAAKNRTHTIKIPLKPVTRDGETVLTGSHDVPT